MSTIYLVEITGKQGVSTTVFRYGTKGYVTKPADTPANTYYAGRVRQPGLYERSCHGGAKTFGLTNIGYGVLDLENSDGALDGLTVYGFDGQTLEIKRGDDAAALSTFTTIFKGTMDQPQLGLETFKLRIRDVLQNLDVALQPTKFAGTNSLPNGLEGTADDLKGKPKPICLGYVFNASPPQVNTSRRIYQVHYIGFFSKTVPATISWSLTVYDKRSPITAGSEKTLTQFGAGATLLAFTVDAGTDVFTTATHSFTTGDGISALSTGGTLPAPLLDTSPYFVNVASPTTFTLHPTKADAIAGTNTIDITTAGTGTLDISNNRTALGCYDWCNDATGGFYFRLGSAPLGQVTCDAVNPSDVGGAYNYGTPADLMVALVGLARPGQTVNTSMAVPAYDAAAQLTKGGIYIDAETSLLQVLGEIMDSGGYHLRALVTDPMIGTVTFGLLGYISSTTSLTLTEGDAIKIERLTSEDVERGIPSWRANINYKRNYTVMSRDQVAGSVTEADIAFVKEEWRTVSAEEGSVKTTYPNSPEINRYSITTDATEAATEAARVKTLYMVYHDIFRVTVSASLTTTLDLGQRVSLTYPRFGMSAGVLLWVMAISPNYLAGTVDLLLWKRA